MATIRKLGVGDWGLGIGRLRSYSLFIFALLLLPLALSLSSCASTRPVVKIGLLAPFEGVHRQEGYAALAAMRTALVETTIPGVEMLPLALDSSRGVERAAQKSLADPAVAVIIGPYWAVEGMKLGVLAADEKWRHPYAPTGDADWAADAIALVSLWVEGEGRTLVLAGGDDGWPESGVPTVLSPEMVGEGQAVLWLGDAAGGAVFATDLWERLPDLPFGLYGAGTEIFRQRLGAQVSAPLFLLAWIDGEYPAWAQTHTPNTPAAYTVYRLTMDRLGQLRGEKATTVWQPAIFILGQDGSLLLRSDR